MAKTISTARGPISIEDRGTGLPLVLLHGFPLDRTMWRYQIGEFSKTNRVIALDLRGFGQTQATPGTVSMGDFADDVAAVLDALQIERAVVCGLSMGGYIAFAFAERHADRLAGLVLCDTRAVADSAEVAKGRRVTAVRVLDEGPAFLTEVMLPKMYAPVSADRQPELLVGATRVIQSAQPEGVAAAARGMAERPDRTAQLGQLKVRTLVIVGESDAISPVEEMRAIAEGLPQAEFVVVPDAGHMAPEENPVVFNQALATFLNSLA